jgi:hypothetical protein
MTQDDFLYFVLGINSVESKQCDTRVLTRLTMTMGEENKNEWRSVVQVQELEAINFIVQKKGTCVRIKNSYALSVNWQLSTTRKMTVGCS